MDRKNTFLTFVWLILPGLLLAPSAWSQYPNVRVSLPTSTDPEEVTIAINPTNPANLVAAANLDYYFVSMDGGQSWVEAHLTSSFGVAGDPSLTYDAAGNLYYGHLSYPGPGQWLDRIVVQKSTDGGITWNDGSGIGLHPPAQQDKEWLATDRTDSPFRNNVYVAWTEFDKYGSPSPQDSSRILFSRSTDSGATWSPPVRVSDTAGDAVDSDGTVEGAVPAIGPNGEVYLAWSGPLGIMFDKSLDGGLTFGRDVFVADQPGGWDFDVPGLSRCNGMPITASDVSDSPYRGTIYVVWSDQRNGSDNTDVFLVKSTDGGDSWGPIKRVNDDNTVSHQFLPWMTVDPLTGVIWIVFYDRRNTSGNATEVYVARSADGGETFDSFRVSETAFTPQPEVFFGDYINIAARGGNVYPIWMRMDNGQLSVWVALIKDTTTTLVAEHRPAPADFTLRQNYPNPFLRATNISFGLRRRSHVRLDVYTLTGELVTQLANSDYPPGDYSTIWDGRDRRGRFMPSGVYFYRLVTERQVITRRLLLLR